MNISFSKDADNLNSFLGICSFIRNFLPDYFNLVAHLFELWHKNSKFIWSEECNRNLELFRKTCKNHLCYSCQILRNLISFKQMHLIRVSQEVTSHKVCNELCPFKSGGRVLTKIELNYDTTAKELLAIYFYVKQNKVCLMKSKFIGY